MIKGTTPTHTFSMPFGEEMIKAIEICYAQNGEVMLSKGIEDCTIEGNTISVKLSQEDTLEFAEGVCVEIQIRILTPADDAIASNVMRVHCHECLFDGVIE